MENNFNKPQRQSQIGIFVLFFDSLRKYLSAIWPILLLSILKFGEVNKLFLFSGIIIFILIIGIISYLNFLNFTFYIDDENEEFIVNEGIINKTKTTIQLNKIQQVNINQSLIQRLIGVYALDVDSAGSSKKEANIKAISHELAISLKSKLISNEARITNQELINNNLENEVEVETTFLEISFFSLLKIGLTTNYLRSLGLILTFFITIYENFKNVTDNTDFNSNDIKNYIEKNVIVNSISLIVVFLLGSVFLFNIVRVIFRYFNFKIVKQKGSLLFSYGLLNTKSTILKTDKAQIVSITRNYFQKKLNILEMKIKQASGNEKDSKNTTIEIPGCNDQESNDILKLLYNVVPEKGIMLKPNYSKLVFSIFMFIGIPLILFFSFGNYVDNTILQYAYFSIVYIIFIGLILFFSYRNNRLYINNQYIIKQSGAWDICKEIIEIKKIQAITTSQLFWHRNLNIGSITIHTAGGNLGFQLGNYNIIKEHVNIWLYNIETSDSNWM